MIHGEYQTCSLCLIIGFAFALALDANEILVHQTRETFLQSIVREYKIALVVIIDLIVDVHYISPGCKINEIHVHQTCETFPQSTMHKRIAFMVITITVTDLFTMSDPDCSFST